MWGDIAPCKHPGELLLGTCMKRLERLQSALGRASAVDTLVQEEWSVSVLADRRFHSFCPDSQPDGRCCSPWVSSFSPYRSFLKTPRQTHLAVYLSHSFSLFGPMTVEMTTTVLYCFVWKLRNMHKAMLN